MPAPIRLYTDENIDPGLALALVERGYDAVSCHAAGNANRAISDEWQLEWAASQDRTILTIDAPDFTRITALWSIQGKVHCGILLVRWTSLGDLIRRTKDFLGRYSADDVRNATMWVS